MRFSLSLPRARALAVSLEFPLFLCFSVLRVHAAEMLAIACRCLTKCVCMCLCVCVFSCVGVCVCPFCETGAFQEVYDNYGLDDGRGAGHGTLSLFSPQTTANSNALQQPATPSPFPPGLVPFPYSISVPWLTSYPALQENVNKLFTDTRVYRIAQVCIFKHPCVACM